ncbi:hypothetical protein HZS_4591 [Henneguya salminicola]|nr:hypothetical protein HZS_4591 [Henneguya salminicola]
MLNNERVCKCFNTKFTGKYCKIHCSKYCWCDECFINKNNLTCMCNASIYPNTDSDEYDMEEITKNEKVYFIAYYTLYKKLKNNPIVENKSNDILLLILISTTFISFSILNLVKNLILYLYSIKVLPLL